MFKYSTIIMKCLCHHLITYTPVCMYMNPLSSVSCKHTTYTCTRAVTTTRLIKITSQSKSVMYITHASCGILQLIHQSHSYHIHATPKKQLNNLNAPPLCGPILAFREMF